jgi:hypothetical protein
MHLKHSKTDCSIPDEAEGLDTFGAQLTNGMLVRLTLTDLLSSSTLSSTATSAFSFDN